MKKYPFILSLLTVICSCHNGTSSDTRTAPQDTTAITGHDALTAYRQWTSTLDTQKIDNAELAIQRFEQTFHGQPADICDTAFTIFDHLHERIAEYIFTSRNGDTLTMTMDPRDPEFKAKPLSPYLKKLKDTLTRNGFHIDADEGSPIIASDYTPFKARIEDHLTPAMKEYITQTIKETREGFQDDAAILIPPDSLAARTVWREKFTRLHPQFIYAGKAADNLLMYRVTLINGLDNTPVEQLEKPGGLTAYYAEAYSFIAKYYPNSPIDAITSPYYKAWQANDITTIHDIKEKNQYTK